MNTIATRLQVTTAAVAVAAAASLVPVAAQAAPQISAPTAPITQVLSEIPLGPATISDFSFFFFGPTPAPGSSTPLGTRATPLGSFTLNLPIIGPLILAPIFKALGIAGKTFCVAGLGISFGGYGSITGSASVGC
ncbi:hypothetical protein [Mycobacterium sp. 3519A]|uniref:hypothetical protein n=1 Tax=Mycobacterium sp. 3519A TaxID=2057184 RepID=UPI0011570C45|nr:hypothetical protein [Mycobacterium sp. 3519A]